ncbi:class I SAM-dependent methyltransferase [Shouchella shacheensis]|uniref:class I SAM-dependent methyltransferase n=1 Tax=Shouchella shacheensis TaxID=1649580 RepID=UPI0007400B86|nr:class I SAM-dependent methyltransferase [Shouchella shacheensis]
MAINEYLQVWNARKWMKQTEPFLKTWHAHLGYSLHLFDYFQAGETVECVAKNHGLEPMLLKRWVDVGLAVDHLEKRRGYKVQTKKRMVKYLSKESNQSVGILLEEMFELHIPTLLSYRERMQGEGKKKKPGMADMVAATSSLLETLTLPKVAGQVKRQKVRELLDVGCGYGGYLRRLGDKFPNVQLDGIEVDQDVCIRAWEANQHENVSIVQGDFNAYQPEKPYDMLMLNNLLYYFPASTRQALFRKSHKLVVPKGTLIVITPLTYEKHGNRFASAFNSFMSAHEEMFPIPSKQELNLYAKDAGFKLIEAKPVVKEGGWYMLVFRKKRR